MKYNYHTHTKRCHHAEGEDREYVEAAIQAGIKTLGFSDHSPMVFPEEAHGYRSFYRVEENEVEDYVKSIHKLRDEYKDQIDIHLGAEMEYYPKCFDYNYKRIKDWGFEYVILGQHFDKNEYDGGSHIMDEADTPEVFKNYVDEAIEGMSTGQFFYFAHPDVPNFSKDLDFYNEQMTRLIEAAMKYKLPLEVNILGKATNRKYPNDNFWRLAGKLGAKAIIGVDAHAPRHLIKAEAVIKAYEPFLNSVGIDVSRETFVDYEKLAKHEF